ncbi:MAG: acetate--CoA ligase [Trueperaceae bacterium]|nr:acetate--CoA ligase [Trueperaceae bacterium]
MSERIESVLQEDRRFSPPAAFKAQAKLSDESEYERLYRQSLDDPDTFWGDVASELHWFKSWDKVVEWEEPFVKWFVGGQTNLSYNCLDRQVEAGRGDKVAIYWEGEPGDSLTLTYNDLLREVSKFANVLKSQGIGKGDCVAIYMPMIPEAVVAMLACARIGAPHSVVFGGFSATAIADRANDAKAKALITADSGYRRGKTVPLKETADEALDNAPSVETMIVVKRTGEDVTMKEGRDHWYHDLMEGASEDCPAEPLDAEHPLFILYTSGSTGKPKGVLHTTGGYQTYTYLTTKYVFDLEDDDIYWCTADIGWITGHSYITYGPLANGATQIMYEGAPNFPAEDRLWEIVEKYKATIFYTAPTAIRAFIKWGDEHVDKHDISSLRLLGTVGEPINPETWMWYRSKIGRNECPVIDTWWQTETGGIMLTTLPGVHDAKPGSAGKPFFGVEPAVVDVDGHEQPANSGGYLVIKRPWPSMLRTVYGDDDRYRAQYWSEVPHVYFAGDGSRQDPDGYFWIMGRVDDVVNVSGHRLGTMEVESALVSHNAVAEAAVVGRPDELKGQAIVAFVTLEGGHDETDELRKALRNHVAKEIGAIAKPDEIRFADALPKTRSGKIMRRLLRNIAAGEEAVGDTSTLEDKSVMDKLMQPG